MAQNVINPSGLHNGYEIKMLGENIPRFSFYLPSLDSFVINMLTYVDSHNGKDNLTIAAKDPKDLEVFIRCFLTRHEKVDLGKKDNTTPSTTPTNPPSTTTTSTTTPYTATKSLYKMFHQQDLLKSRSLLPDPSQSEGWSNLVLSNFKYNLSKCTVSADATLDKKAKYEADQNLFTNSAERLSTMYFNYLIGVGTSGVVGIYPDFEEKIEYLEPILFLRTYDYRRCILNKLSRIKNFSKCVENTTECEHCREDIAFTAMLSQELFSLMSRMSADENIRTPENYKAAMRYMDVLDNLCQVCPDCEDLPKKTFVFFRGVEMDLGDGNDVA